MKIVLENKEELIEILNKIGNIKDIEIKDGSLLLKLDYCYECTNSDTIEYLFKDKSTQILYKEVTESKKPIQYSKYIYSITNSPPSKYDYGIKNRSAMSTAD